MSEPRIAILLPDLRGGGAERLHIILATEWTRQGVALDFVLLRRVGDLLTQLPSGTKIVDLKASRIRSAWRPLVRYLHESPPDALLAAMWPLTMLAPIAARRAGFRGRVLVSEHNNMTAAYAGRGMVHRLVMASSMRLGYHLADAVVGVSRGVVDDISRHSRMSRERFKVIHNPACIGRDASGSDQPTELRGRGRIILAVGALKSQKRHDLLLQAFAQSASRARATLCIVGDGALRRELGAQAERLGIEDAVVFAGFQLETAPWYAHADLFVLSSDYEGFGNVIVEALEQGVPVVSTDCPSGPREILEDGKYGILVQVGDVVALAKAMDDALSREHDHEALKRRAHDFSVDKAADAYLDLLLPGWRHVPPRTEAIG